MEKVTREIINGRDNMVCRCFLLSDGTVLKKYICDPDKRPQKQNAEHWTREISALKILSGKPHFPELFSIDCDNKQIRMSYCGQEVTKSNLPANWIHQCEEIEHMLTQKKIFHNDIFCKNILVKNEILYLIDFGMWSSSPYRNNSMVYAIRKELGL